MDDLIQKTEGDTINMAQDSCMINDGVHDNHDGHFVGMLATGT